MSNFIKRTKNPMTLEWEDAEWLDDYYGKHNYAVRFPSGAILDERDWKFETEELTPPQG